MATNMSGRYRRRPSSRIRQSILLRGLIFETDETMTLGADGMPSDIVIRGVTPSGDAGETFAINGGQASWTSPVDKGGAAYPGNSYYVSQGGPFLSFAPQVDRLAAAGPAGLALLPSGKATLQKISELEIDGPGGAKKKVELQLLRGTAQTPQPVWTSDGKFFGALVGLTILPQGYEGNMDKMQAAQDAAIAALAPATAAKFLTADAKRPVLFKNVQIYDARRREVRRQPECARRERQDRQCRRRTGFTSGGNAGDRRRGQDARPGPVGQPHARAATTSRRSASWR